MPPPRGRTTVSKAPAPATGQVLQAHPLTYNTAPEAESYVLGALLLDGKLITRVWTLIRAEMFTGPNVHIYQALYDLADSGQFTVYSYGMVLHELRRKGHTTIPPVYLAQLTERVVGSTNLLFYAAVIVEMYMRREMQATAQAIQALTHTDDIFAALQEAELQLANIVSRNAPRATPSLADIAASEIATARRLAQAGTHLTGVPAGLGNVDRLTGGWQRGDLIIIAARPGMGKTAFALHAARAALEKVPVALFSLEMGAGQLVQRLIATQTRIDLFKIRSGQMAGWELEHFEATARKLGELPLYIDDAANITLSELRTRARRMVSVKGAGLIIVDYLQLVTGAKAKNGNREQEVASVSRALKALAKELNVPVIALAQLGRGADKGTERPALSHLRESGAIEQDADLVCFLYRPEKHGVLVDDIGASTEGLAEFIIAKHRNGPADTARLDFVPRHGYFSER